MFRNHIVHTAVAILACISGVVGCSMLNSSDDTEASVATGTVRLPLTAQGATGTRYRLSTATFTVVGGDATATLSSADAPSAAELTTTLVSGSYAVTLASGWQMEVQDSAGAWTAVPAELVSATTQTAAVVDEGSTLVVFQFRVNGEIVQTGSGDLRVGIAVEEANVCVPDWGTAPSSVSDWVNESWNAELGTNVRNLKTLLLDSAMQGKGQINICVRWGATTAPTAAIKTGMEAAAQKLLNNWFSQLSGYGCFPYPSITAKVTGWAVRPGNTAWVADLGSAVRVYTETDGEGEPMCPDSCSFMANSAHTFPNCAGGEAAHHDYAIWLDDMIGDGVGAVGGNWGLRTTVGSFVSAMSGNNVMLNQEVGHGFGFQDYYDWTGSRPTGGSIMIAGSAATVTSADTWLLRRAWQESRTLRGW